MNSFHRLVLLGATVLECAAFGQDQKGPPPAAAGRVYYISSAGDDANDAGGVDKPWATLSKVTAVVRAGDTVRLRCGDVFYGTFKPPVSGTAAAPITLEPYGDGAKPVITGFKPVGNWTPVGNGRYEATLAAFPSEPLAMVRFNGRLQPKGRLPKKGFAEGFRIRSHVKNSQITSLEDIPEVTGGEIVQKKYQWIIDRGRIDEISRNPNGGKTEATIKFTDFPGTRYECFDKHGFFVQNHVNCLTEPGDWCYDAATRKLTVYSGSGPPGDGQVEAAGIDVLADLSGKSYIRCSNIAFVGSNADAARLDSSAHVSFEGCDFSCVGRNGISVVPVEGKRWYRESHHGTVRNCRISDVNNNGIDAGKNPDWTIVGNTLVNIALNPGMGGNGDGQHIAVYAPGDDSLVQYNDISYVGYTGVYFTGNGTQIRNNHVHHFCMIKSDGGGIYTYEGEARKAYPRPRQVDRNIVHDGVGAIDGACSADEKNPYGPQCQGLYMDGNAADVIVSNNTVFNVASAGLWLGSNCGITAFGNT